jgi:hypothetical protein
VNDLFGTAAGAAQEETISVDLPIGKWFVARTSDRGGAAPRLIEGATGPFLFKTGLYVIGGDGKSITERMYGKYTFFQAFIRPNYKDQGGPKSQADHDALNGRLVGFMNTLLAPGTEDKDTRWQTTLTRLGEYAKVLSTETDSDLKLTPEMFSVQVDIAAEGEPENIVERQDNAAYMASVFVILLTGSPEYAIVNQKLDTGRDGTRSDLVVGSFKDATEKNAAKTSNGKLFMFESREGETFEFYGESAVSAEDVTQF